MLKFSTITLFEWAEEYAGVSNGHSAENLAKIEDVITDEEEESLQDVFITTIFGDEGRIDYKAWADAVLKKNTWIFDPISIRKTVLEKAGVNLVA